MTHALSFADEEGFPDGERCLDAIRYLHVTHRQEIVFPQQKVQSLWRPPFLDVHRQWDYQAVWLCFRCGIWAFIGGVLRAAAYSDHWYQLDARFIFYSGRSGWTLRQRPSASKKTGCCRGKSGAINKRSWTARAQPEQSTRMFSRGLEDKKTARLMEKDCQLALPPGRLGRVK